jgi:hypothetical protein
MIELHELAKLHRVINFPDGWQFLSEFFEHQETWQAQTARRLRISRAKHDAERCFISHAWGPPAAAAERLRMRARRLVGPQKRTAG